MAHCSVLEAHQKETDRPSKRIKRSGGHSLVRRGLAEWIKPNVLLHMRPTPALHLPVLSLHPPHLSAHPPHIRPYIPEKLPANLDKQLGIIQRDYPPNKMAKFISLKQFQFKEQFGLGELVSA